jgi:hypothetical protein
MPSWISGDDEAHYQHGCQETRSSGCTQSRANVPVNHDAASAVAAFMVCSGRAREVAPCPTARCASHPGSAPAKSAGAPCRRSCHRETRVFL